MEYWSARPVVIDGTKSSALLIGIEDLDEAKTTEIDGIAGGHAYLILPAARLRRLGIKREAPGRVALPVVDRDRVEALALRADGRIDAPVRPADETDEEALELARLSLVLPAVIVVPLAKGIEIDPAKYSWRELHPKSLMLSAEVENVCENLSKLHCLA